MSTVRLYPAGQQVECGPGQEILPALEDGGFPLPSDCRAGHCGTCKVRLRSGAVDRGLYLPMALTEDEVAAGYLLPCIARPLTDLVELDCAAAQAAADALPVALFPPQRGLRHVVVDKLPRTPEIVELRLRPVGDRLRYWPGQYVELAGPAEAGSRPYSVANAPHPDGEIALHVARTAGGRVSGWVHDELRAGQVVSVSGAYGTFVGDPAAAGPVLCLAGGSGLAPVLALTEAALRRGYPDPVTLLFSARTGDDLYAEGLVAYWQQRYPGFRFVRTITQPAGADVAPPVGRVPDVLPGLVGDLSGHQVFIAGPPSFVTSCAAAAAGLGVRRERLHVENYFPQPRTDGVAA
jgi:CDP-4-dehydro-6-deoxyglucose reductase